MWKVEEDQVAGNSEITLKGLYPFIHFIEEGCDNPPPRIYCKIR